MRKSKFSESQIAEILKEAETGLAVAEVARKHGISAATFYQWRRSLHCNAVTATGFRCCR